VYILEPIFGAAFALTAIAGAFAFFAASSGALAALPGLPDFAAYIGLPAAATFFVSMFPIHTSHALGRLSASPRPVPPAIPLRAASRSRHLPHPPRYDIF